MAKTNFENYHRQTDAYLNIPTMQPEYNRRNAFCCLMLVYHIRIPDYRYVIEVNRMKNGPDLLTHTLSQSVRQIASLLHRNLLWVVIL